MGDSVIIITHYSFPGGSAASLRMLNIAEGFLENGTNVHVISAYSKPSRREHYVSQTTEVSLKEYYAFEKPAVPRLSNDMVYKSRFSDFAFRIVKNITEEEKICLVYIYEGTSYVYFNKTTRYLQRKNIAFTVDITEYRDRQYSLRSSHMQSGISWKQRVSNILLYPDYYLGKKIILGRASFFICISTFLQNHMTHYGKDSLVIPGFEKLDRPSPGSTRSVRISILYVGMLIERDAPEAINVLLTELYCYKDMLEFRFLGRYDRDPKTKSLMDQMKESFPEMVISLGEVDESRIEKELEMCDIFLLPRKDSVEERCAFPTRLAEYLALSKPTVISPVGDIPLYLKTGESCCFLELSDGNHIVPASKTDILKLIQNQVFREQVGRGGNDAGQKYFDRVRNTKRLLIQAGETTSFN